MKITLFLLIIGLVNVFASDSYSQSEKVSLNLKNATIEDALDQIEQNSGYYFAFNQRLIDVSKHIDINVINKSIKDVLKQIFRNSDVDYVLINKQIVLSPKTIKNSLFTSNLQIRITGKVTSAADNTPIPGVNVAEKGTQNGTMTDADGNYDLNVSNANATLVFSSIGYESQEIPLDGRTNLGVTLQEKNEEIEQVVVVGYGTQKKSDITGSVSSVSKDRLKDMPVTNVLQVVQGAVAGVNITTNSELPGGNSTFVIRGINSINASRNPLLVVDGIVYNGSYNDFNPSDIESIEILKDASSVAIYGTRGSNGVVLLTTKKGTKGKPRINYSTYYGINRIANKDKLQPMNGAQFVQKNRDYCKQRGINVVDVFNQAEIENLAKGIETDWLDEISQPGSIQNHELSISGGSENVKYFLSAGYQKEIGNLKGYQYGKYSIRSNVDVKLTNWLSAGTTLSYIAKNTDGAQVSLYQALRVSPWGQEYNADGTYKIFPMYSATYYWNPLIPLYSDRINRTKSLNTSIYTEAKLLKGLTYKVNFGYSLFPTFYSLYEGRLSNVPLGHADIQNTHDSQWLMENIVNYTLNLNKHEFLLTALYSAQEFEHYYNRLQGTDFINDNLGYNNIAAAKTQTITSDYRKENLLSQMFRLNYNYAHKYLLTATVRRDGFSGFGANNKYAVFPSVALGWNLTEEEFMKSVKGLDELKLRFSYGITGNQAISAYQTYSRFATTQYIYKDAPVTAITPNTLGNDDLK